MKHSLKRGFSLVEMAVVIAVIGVIIGGVVAGQSMIRGAAINSVGIELTGHADNVLRFKKKYSALPGDMNDAINYWGAAHVIPSTCRTTTTNDKRTCNGNGNGEIAHSTASSNEEFRFWQHLSNAGMLAGSYTGISDSGTVGYAATPDVNVPAGPLDDSGFSVWSTFGSNTGGIYGSSGFWDMEPTVVIQFGTDPGGNNWRMDGRSLTPREQKSIDTKYDDGLPQSGAMMSRKGMSNCNTSTDPAVADYNVAFADTACFLELILVRHWD